MLGVQISLYTPEWDRSCESCKKWMYNEDGTRQTRNFDDGVKRWTEFRLRTPPRTPLEINTPCHKCPKIPISEPDKRPEKAIELTDYNREAIQHYQRCKATGNFPDDEIVARNAAAIREVEDAYDRMMQRVLLARLGGLKAD